MIRRILIPLDGSEGAEAALGHAVLLGKAFDGELHLLRVLSRAQTAGSGEPVDPLAWRLARARAGTYLSRLARELRDMGLQVTTEVQEGLPGRGHRGDPTAEAPPPGDPLQSRSGQAVRHAGGRDGPLRPPELRDLRPSRPIPPGAPPPPSGGGIPGDPGPGGRLPPGGLGPGGGGHRGPGHRCPPPDDPRPGPPGAPEPTSRERGLRRAHPSGAGGEPNRGGALHAGDEEPPGRPRPHGGGLGGALPGGDPPLPGAGGPGTGTRTWWSSPPTAIGPAPTGRTGAPRNGFSSRGTSRSWSSRTSWGPRRSRGRGLRRPRSTTGMPDGIPVSGVTPSPSAPVA
jgi:hypothetical protein